MFLVRKAGNEESKPAAWRTLHHAVVHQERRVQELKETKGRHQTCLDTLATERLDIKQQEAHQDEQLKSTLCEVQSLASELLPTLLSVTNEEEKRFLVAASPEGANLDGANLPPKSPALVPLPVAVLRHRRPV